MFVTFTMLREKVLDKIGALSSLLTTSKASLVEAINELFTSVSNGKAAVASAITAKGVVTSSDATFTQMAANIGQIETGGGTFIEKTITANGTYTASADGADGYSKVIANVQPTNHVYDTFTLASDVAGTDTTVYTLTGEALSHKGDSSFVVMLHPLAVDVSKVAVVGGTIGNRLIGQKTDQSVSCYGYTGYTSQSTGKFAGVNITHPVSSQSGTFTADFWVAADGKVHIKGASSYKWQAGDYLIVAGW